MCRCSDCVISNSSCATGATECTTSPDVPGHFRRIRGYKIHYEQLGHGTNVILMLHGGFSSARMDFEPQLRNFDHNLFTIVAPDMPGHGYSRPPERPYHLDRELYNLDADIAADLIMQLGHATYNVLGWSAGGMVAMCLASRYPNNVNKLVVWGTAGAITPRHKEVMQAGGDVVNWTREKRAKFEQMYGKDNLQQMWSRHLAFLMTLDDVCRFRARDIRCPTLLLYGDKDFVPMSETQHLIDSISDCVTHKFQNGRHDMHLQFPDEFDRVVKKFLTEQ